MPQHRNDDSDENWRGGSSHGAGAASRGGGHDDHWPRGMSHDDQWRGGGGGESSGGTPFISRGNGNREQGAWRQHSHRAQSSSSWRGGGAQQGQGAGNATVASSTHMQGSNYRDHQRDIDNSWRNNQGSAFAQPNMAPPPAPAGQHNWRGPNNVSGYNQQSASNMDTNNFSANLWPLPRQQQQQNSMHANGASAPYSSSSFVPATQQRVPILTQRRGRGATVSTNSGGGSFDNSQASSRSRGEDREASVRDMSVDIEDVELDDEVRAANILHHRGRSGRGASAAAAHGNGMNDNGSGATSSTTRYANPPRQVILQPNSRSRQMEQRGGQQDINHGVSERRYETSPDLAADRGYFAGDEEENWRSHSNSVGSSNDNANMLVGDNPFRDNHNRGSFDRQQPCDISRDDDIMDDVIERPFGYKPAGSSRYEPGPHFGGGSASGENSGGINSGGLFSRGAGGAGAAVGMGDSPRDGARGRWESGSANGNHLRSRWDTPYSASKRHKRHRNQHYNPAYTEQDGGSRMTEESLASALASLGGPAYADRTKCDDAIDPISQQRIWDLDADTPGTERRANYAEIGYLFSYVERDPSNPEKEYVRGFAIESVQQLLLQARKSSTWPCLSHPVTGIAIPHATVRAAEQMIALLKEAGRIAPIRDEDPTTWTMEDIMSSSDPIGSLKKLAFSVFQPFFIKASIELEEDCVLSLPLKDLKLLAKEAKGMFLRNFDAGQRRSLCPETEGCAFQSPPFWESDVKPWIYYILSNLHYVTSYDATAPDYLRKLAMYVFVAAIATVSPKVRERYQDSFALDFDYPGGDIVMS